MFVRCLLIFIVSLISPFVKAQEAGMTVMTSLDSAWKVYTGGQFKSYKPGNDHPRAIYFLVEANKYQGAILICSAKESFSFFINHQLIAADVKDKLAINLDSISKKHSAYLQCVIFQREGIKQLTTLIVKPASSQSTHVITKRKAAHFFNFSILASLIVFAYFIILMRTLPRLAANYFNVFRLLSLQEREENLVGSRVTSTANILFYLFASLLSGLVLTILFFYGSETLSLPQLSINSAWDAFAQWLKWSAFVFLLLIFKLLLIYSLCSLFDIRELVSFHFFNFLRLYFLLYGLGAVLSLVYFILKGQNIAFYSYVVYGMIILVLLWVILICLKLFTKVSFRFFHLFSYLCISEIIPMMIIFKILLF